MAPHVAPHTVDIDGPVHFMDYGGPENGPTIVCVHGLGGSHLNWLAIAPSLAGHARVLTLDLVGHGLTPAHGRTADIEGHQRLLNGFLHQVVVGPAILIGNSMGGLVSVLQAAEEPDTVAGLVLIDPALPTAQWGRFDPRVLTGMILGAVPGLGELFVSQRRRFLSPQQSVHRALAVCCVEPSRVPPDVVAALVQLSMTLDREAHDVAYLASARSLARMLLRPKVFTHKLVGVHHPTLLLHGDSDRLVPLASARELSRIKPEWEFCIAEQVGHVPMLEVPVWTLEKIMRWLGAEGEPAERSSTGTATGEPPERSSTGATREA